MEQSDRSLKSVPFLNGLVIPLFGTKGLNRQIDIQIKNSHRESGLGYFAFGHMVTSCTFMISAAIILHAI